MKLGELLDGLWVDTLEIAHDLHKSIRPGLAEDKPISQIARECFVRWIDKAEGEAARYTQGTERIQEIIFKNIYPDILLQTDLLY
jgi:hypothetical protein